MNTDNNYFNTHNEEYVEINDNLDIIVDNFGRRDGDYWRRAVELFELIKQLPNASERDISNAERIFSYAGNLYTIAYDTIHPSMLAVYNRISGENLTF